MTKGNYYTDNARSYYLLKEQAFLVRSRESLKLCMPFDLAISLLGNHPTEIFKNVDKALGTLHWIHKAQAQANLLQDRRSYGLPIVTATLPVPANTNHQPDL